MLAAPASASVPTAEAKALAADQEIGFEKAELALERQSNAPDLQKTARTELGSAFGGVWIDNEDGATIKLGVVEGEPGTVTEGGNAAAGSGTGAEVVKVEHSYAELEAAARWLSERLLDRDTGLGHYFTSGIRTSQNGVLLGVPADRRLGSDQKQFLAQAKSRFGSMLLLDYYEGELAHRGCGWPYCDPPLRGGNRLLREGEAGLEGHCTGGFVTRGRGVNHDLFLLTAGHCALGLGNTALWSIPPAPIGSFHNFINGGPGDAGIIRVDNEGYWKARSWVYVKGGNGIAAHDQYPIYDDADPIVGMHVCTNGGFSFALSKKSWCGYVTDVDTTFSFTKNMVRTSVCTEYGDSGGPLFANNTAYGVLSGGPGDNFCDSYYMEIQPAEDLMNVDVTHATKPPSPPKPPVAVTTSASGVGATQATINGTVDPEGSSTEYFFEYGLTTAYGSITPVPDGSAGSGSAALSFGAAAAGLEAGTTYHYRAVASNEGGISYGADKTFTTRNRIIFADATNNNSLSYWTWEPTVGWQQAFLFGHPVMSGSSPTGTLFYNGRPRFYFADATNNDSITEWSWNGLTGWQQTFLFGHRVAKGSSPAAVMIDGTPHVFFVDADRGNQITEWIWSEQTGWQQNFIATNPVAANSSPEPIVVNGEPRVFFADATTNRGLTVLIRPGSSWQQIPFGGDSLTAGSSPSAIYHAGMTQVYFANASKSNTLAAWTWSPTSLSPSYLYGHTIAAGSSPAAAIEGGFAKIYFADATNANSITHWSWEPSLLKEVPLFGHAVMAGSSPQP